MIKEIKIKDTEHLIRTLNELPNNYIFRGHADSNWKLESTLERTIGSRWSSELAKKCEDHCLSLFKSKYHIYNGEEHEPKSKLAWLSVMQHYGVPTRLIDFTESPYIALYFALEAYDPLLKNDLAIFAIDYNSVMDASLEYIAKKDSSFNKKRHEIIGLQDDLFDNVVDRFSYEVLWITEPLELNARMDRQSGTFLISGDKDRSIESLFNSDIYGSVEIYKYIVPQNIYENIYALLRKMSISAKSIYGDLAGLAKSIKMDIQVHTR